MTGPGGWEIVVIIVIALLLMAIIASGVYFGVKLANRGSRTDAPSATPPGDG